jgi:8-oxo-dGTP pyrophosphatase MutT (NUDIX family)
VLLVHDASTDAWVLPGGAVDPDEVPADALVREVWEETGLHVQPLAVLGVYGGPSLRVHYGNGDRVSYVLTAFTCAVLSGRPRPDGDETLAVSWTAPDALRTLPRPGWLDTILADALTAGPGARFTSPAWRPEPT